MVNEVDAAEVYNSFEDIAKYIFTKEGHEKCKFPSSIFGPGDSRSIMFQQRYYTILQQIFRDSKFIDTARGKRGADFPILSFGSDGPNEKETAQTSVNSSSLFVIHQTSAEETNWRFEITPVESLPGSVGIKVVFGLLSKTDGGKIILEDIHQSVPLKLDNMKASDDYITENTFVLAKGEMIDDIFIIHELTLPPVPQQSLCESSVNVSGGPGELTEELLTHSVGDPPEDSSIAIISSIDLDNPKTLDQLNVLFTGFEEADAIPSAFVLVGNFNSRPFNSFSGDSLRGFQKGFDVLSQVLSRHPKTLEMSKIVIVPGHTDPGSGVYPQPPLADSLIRGLSSRYPNVVRGTNPCRIRFYNKYIVVYSGSIVSGLKHNRLVASLPIDELSLLHSPQEREVELEADRLTRCILSQMHLCPGTARDNAIVWDHDAGMRLYPPPHALFVCDPNMHPFQKLVHGETLVVSVPKFSQNGFESTGEFHLYSPSQNESTLSGL
jgi:DNA polymerase epsilon subunit 2